MLKYSPATRGWKYLRRQAQHSRCHIADVFVLPFGPQPDSVGPSLPFCQHTGSKFKKGCVVSGYTIISTLLRERSRCSDAHVLSSSPVWEHAPPDDHMSPQQILGELFVRSQLAACLEVPGCKGLGLIKPPLMRPVGNLGQADIFEFFCMCVLLIPSPGYRRRESRKGYWNQNTKGLRESTLWSPKGKED